MRLQGLVAALGQNGADLAERMKLCSDAIIINQCDQNSYLEYEHHHFKIKCYNFAECGVGLSRNNALLRAGGDISLFADDDIIYNDNYANEVLQEFGQHPDADVLLFNMDVNAERATYHTDVFHRVRLYNCGRYPAYSMAVRTRKLHHENITFSLLFGGGAKYSCGEDSLFIKDCINKGLHVYASPIAIGREVARPSTWFNGYTEKFFFDRGVLFYFLYKRMAQLMTALFLLKHGTAMCQNINIQQAYRLMIKGIREARGK